MATKTKAAKTPKTPKVPAAAPATLAALTDALKLVAAVCPKRDVKPILAYVRLTTTADATLLRATDLEYTVSVQLPALGLPALDVLVHPGRLLGLIAALGDEPVALTLADSTLTLAGGASEYKLLICDDLKDYPDFSLTPPKGEPTTVTATALARMIGLTECAVATDNTRWAVNSFLFKLKGNRLDLVTTDARRLALATTNGQTVSGGEPGTWIVPAKAVDLLAKTIAFTGADVVGCHFAKNEAWFTVGGVTILTRLAEGRFPPYDELFSKKLPVQIALPVRPLYDAARKASVCANDSEGRRLDLEFRGEQVTLSSADREVGTAKVTLPLAAGETFRVVFDAGYLLDVLATVDDDAALTMSCLIDKVNGKPVVNTQPVVFTAGDYRHLLMPLS